MTTGAPYQLSIDGFAPDCFRVRSFKGNESISEAWWFDLVVTAPAGEDVERGALAQRATLIFDVRESPRAFYGVVSAVRLAEVHAVDHAVKYVVRVVPRLWLLRRKTRTRIFQQMRVPDIVSSVLLEAGITTRWQLVRAYPEREYCTQYEETDYRFVRRLLAEAGIYFYFFGGGPVSASAFAADAAVGAAAAVGSSVAGMIGGSALGGVVGAAAQMAETLIPGDTVVGADDAPCYPPVAGDDAGALAASTAAAMAPAVSDLVGGALGDAGGITSAAVGAASAIAGTIIADVTEGGRGAPVLHFMGNEAAHVAAYDKVTRFTLKNTVRSSGGAFREYDPDRPMVLLQSVAVSTQPFPPSPLELAAEAAAAAETVATTAGALLGGPAAGALGAVSGAIATVDSVVNEVGAALGQKVPFEVYQHHGPFLFPKWAFGNDEAPRILRQKRRRASIADGEGGCCDLSPAHRFTLADHPAAQLDGDYVVTSVEHRGESHPGAGSGGEPWRVYWNRFECAPAQMPYPPPRPKRKSVQVALTAVVVGPAGEEIYVDEKGQIKVQFHWDRDGTYDDHSSCWIRVMQPWAGAGWGHQFIPRVGMEVVVTFEGGDPDKPMVLGSLYNGTHPSSFALPEDRTRSGIRTSSSPGGDGFNELSFEDRAGAEQVFVHAQKDYDEQIVNNQTSAVGNSRAEKIAVDKTLDVGGVRSASVGREDRLLVGGAQVTEVAGDRNVRVGGGSATTVMGGHALDVRGNRALVVGTPQKPASSDHYVNGTASFGASDTVVLVAANGITLQCGDASIELTSKKIVLRAPTLELSPTESVECAVKDGPSLTLSKDVEILSKKFRVFTESGALELDQDFKVKGASIKLGYDPSKPSQQTASETPETKPFSCKFANYLLKPYVNKHYHLVVLGQRFEGQTDGEGLVKHDIPKAATQVAVRIWLDDYPEGRQMVYELGLSTLPPVSGVAGAKSRLKNLGYYRGPIDDVAEPELATAVADFQTDHKDSHGLDATGELDQGTAGALEEVHGV